MTSDHDKGATLSVRGDFDWNADRTVCILGRKVDVDVEAAFLVIFKPLYRENVVQDILTFRFVF